MEAHQPHGRGRAVGEHRLGGVEAARRLRQLGRAQHLPRRLDHDGAGGTIGLGGARGQHDAVAERHPTLRRRVVEPVGGDVCVGVAVDQDLVIDRLARAIDQGLAVGLVDDGERPPGVSRPVGHAPGRGRRRPRQEHLVAALIGLPDGGSGTAEAGAGVGLARRLGRPVEVDEALPGEAAEGVIAAGNADIGADHRRELDVEADIGPAQLLGIDRARDAGPGGAGQRQQQRREVAAGALSHAAAPARPRAPRRWRRAAPAGRRSGWRAAAQSA